MRTDSYEINGAIVFWKLAPRSDRDKIVAGLTDIGLEAYAPKERTPYATLADAARSAFPAGHLVRPLEKNKGVAIVKELRGDVHRGNDYRGQGMILCPENGHISEYGGLVNWEIAQQVDTYYHILKNALPPAAVGHTLARIAVEAFSGTKSLRDSGGIYWIPKEELQRWEVVAAIMENAAKEGTSEVHAAFTANTPSTVRAVRNSIVEELAAAMETIRGELRDQEIGPKAIATRRDQLVAYGRKLSLYENVLGEALDDIRLHLEETELLAAQAELVALGGE